MNEYKSPSHTHLCTQISEHEMATHTCFCTQIDQKLAYTVHKEKEFQPLENFKKNVLMHPPVAKNSPWTSLLSTYTIAQTALLICCWLDTSTNSWWTFSLIVQFKSTVMRKRAKEFNISGWLFFSLVAKSKVPIHTQRVILKICDS